MKVKKYKINVTELDIVRGIPGHECQCMLARAIKRTLKRRVSVSPGLYRGTCQIGKVKLSLPEQANKKAVLFDALDGYCRLCQGRARLEVIKPFSFTLRLPAD